jgi:glycosyltransferase involved in cell wall biosynthesis
LHILFLTDNFPPEVNAPASRTFEHCREWVNAGHQVTVITCAPNFPKGKVFDGYHNRLWQTETVEGIGVIRVWSYITANEGFLRRTLDYLSFMISAVGAAPFVRKPDIVVATSPQFFTACAGWLVSTLRRAPFVFELRDLWPESIRAVGAMNQKRLLDWLERIELFLYRRADLIVSVTTSFRENLATRGIDPGKVTVVTNGVDVSLFSPRAKDLELTDALGLRGKFVAGYIGTHGMAHALETILRAAEQLQATPGGDVFRILLIGGGAKKAELVETARRRRLNNVIFVDTVSKSEIVRYWSLLDASIIHLRNNALFESVIPSKLFESMAMGIPVLHGVPGESARIVETENVGIVFESENHDALCQGLEVLRSNEALHHEFAANGPVAVGHYDRSALARKMLESLEMSVAAQRGKPPAA